MPRLFAAALLVALAFPTASGAQDRVDLSDRSDAERLSYAFGFDTANSLRSDSAVFAHFDRDVFARGFEAGVSGDSTQIAFMYGYQFGNRIATDENQVIDADRFTEGFDEGLVFETSQLSEEELQRLSAAIQEELQMRRLREAAETDSLARQRLDEIEANTAASAAFLAEVRAREGVQSTPGGVLYTQEAAGEGEEASGESSVRVIYTGRLANGTEFDSSDGEPATFSLQRVVPGFREGLTGMMPGGKRTLYIAPAMGYGMSGGGGGSIPPNAALVFDVELVEVLAPAAPPPPRPARN